MASFLPNDPGALILAQCVHEIPTSFLLWLLTRSRPVFLFSLLATVVAYGLTYGLAVTPGLAASPAADIYIFIAWHLAFASILLTWAISARLSQRSPQCAHCGYRIEFITSQHCPECGHTLGAT